MRKVADRRPSFVPARVTNAQPSLRSSMLLLTPIAVLSPDQWHEPYMSSDELDREIAAGVAFWGYAEHGALQGVIGLQPVRDVDLIRHAYVLPGMQRRGIGSRLLQALRNMSTKQMLVGTWAAAQWAIRFYERHGFALVSPPHQTALLTDYWNIPQRQIETSVVLAHPPYRRTA
jgi:GNAT superfamily N-acetyltransferase